MQESWIQDPNRNPNLNSQMFETAQQSLITASENLQIRSEVSHLLHSMLTDLETQDSLYTHYTHQQQLTRLQQDLTKTQMELEERRAYQTHMIQQRRLVGDQFVSEMFALSQRIQELSSWKEAHEKKVEEYDLVKRELERTKESIRNLQRSNSLTTNANHHQHQSTAVNANFIQSAKTMDSKDAATEMEKPKLTTNLQTNSTNIATTNTANAPMEKDNHPNAEEIETPNHHSKTVPDETAPHTESTKSTIKAKKTQRQTEEKKEISKS